MENCIDCKNHVVVNDPDPTDWFCDDDVAVLCKLSLNKTKSKYYSSGQLFEYEPITVSCRPHYIRKECDVPVWCPLNEGRKI